MALGDEIVPGRNLTWGYTVEKDRERKETMKTARRDTAAWNCRHVWRNGFMWARRFLPALSACMALTLSPVHAAPVTAEQAAAVASQWVRSSDFVNGAILGSAVSSVRAVANSWGDTMFYVVKFEEGGFAAVSPDDRILPVLSFSESADLEETEDNPLYVLLCADVESRLSALEEYDTAVGKAGSAPGDFGGTEDEDGNYIPSADELIAEAQDLWNSLTLAASSGGGIEKAGSGQYSEIEKAGAGKPTTVMVEPIIKSTWDQSTVGSYMGRPRFYNYYVYEQLGRPYAEDTTDWPCGCVATAFAQIMRKYQWPKTSIPEKTMIASVNGSKRKFNTIAGKFDWANMPLKPSASFTTAQRNAIAALTYNVGVASGMNYKQGSSGADQTDAGNALTSFFGYASARSTSGTNLETRYLESGILANLEHGSPVVISLFNSSKGHCVVADGYGYSGGKPYVHLNLGWSRGGENDWYLLPTVQAGKYSYNMFRVLTYNIFPEETGFIICGKVTKGSSAVSGATVTATGANGNVAASTKTKKNGMYTLVVPGNATYTVKAVSGKASGERKNVSISVTYDGVPNKWGQDISISEQTVKSYTVTFDANGGTGGKMSAQTFTNGTGQLKKCTYTKEGAVFKGWAKTKGGVVAHEDEEWIAIFSNITLYAVWEDYAPTPEIMTVTFFPNGAPGSAYKQEFEDGSALSLLPCRFARDGFEFLGWACSANGDVEYYDCDWILLFSDISLYAVWEERHGSRAEWTISADGRLTAVKLNGDKEVTIPSNVKTIGNMAFNHLADVEKVVIPSSVAKIEPYAFAGCTGLKEVSLGQGLVEIGNYAFSGCTALEDVFVPGSVTRFGEGVFQGCVELKAAAFGNGVGQVPYATFMYCDALSSVSLPATIWLIGDYAFGSCESLKTLVIPASVTSISSKAFYGAGIETFEVVHLGNYSYFDPDSALVAWNSMTLVAAPAGRTDYEVPAECRAVGPYAFSMCPGLKSVRIGPDVTEISANAFVGCQKIEVAILPVAFEGNLPEGLFASSPDVRIFYSDAQCRMITISFNANGGDGEMEPIKIVSGGYVRFPACTFTDYWNEFVGWSLSPDGIAVYADGDSESFLNDITLYAVWEHKSPRTLRYYPFPGDEDRAELFTPVGEATTISDNLVVRSGYKYLAGWSLTPEGEVDYVVGQKLVPLEDMTFYGVWGKAQGPTFEIEDGVLKKAYTDGGWNEQGEIPVSKVREFTIPSSVTNIAKHAFRTECNWSIGKVKIPSSVRTISEHAFWGCGLTELEIEGGEVEIGKYAFRDCESLKKVTIGDGVVTIGEHAFWCCESLTSVTIGDGVAVIDDCAFRDCYRLGKIMAGDCDIFIHKDAFYLGIDDWSDWMSTSGSLAVVDDVSAVARSIVSFDGNGGEGFMASRTFYGDAALRLPACGFRRSGFRFAGWQTPEGMYVANNAKFSTSNDTVLAATWEAYDGLARFTETSLSVPEGGKFIVTVSGGSETSAASIKVQLSHQTSSAADLDLGKTKLPIAIEWAKGEVCDKTIVIPVKTDKTLENDETFVLQLSDAVGMGMADGGHTLYATITDTAAEALSAKVDSGSATKSEIASVAKLQGMGAPLFVLADPAEGGTVKGAGRYEKGKKVVLSAKAAKGWVFAGWYDTSGNPLEGTVDWRQASFPIMAEGAASQVIARFAPVSEDGAIAMSVAPEMSTYRDGTFDFTVPVDSVSFPKVTVKNLPSGLKFDAKALRIYGKVSKPGVYGVEVMAENATSKRSATGVFSLVAPNFSCTALPNLLPAKDAYDTVKCGVALDPGFIDCKPLDGWTVKVAGLPAGLKYDKKTGLVTGVTTAKAGSYTVTFTASKKGEENQVATITLNVDAMPTDIVGAYNGMVGGFADVGDDDSWRARGMVALSVAANGKLSAKATLPSGTISFSANGWDSASNGVYRVEMSTKAGDRLFLELDSARDWKGARVETPHSALKAANGAELLVVAWRNEHGKTGRIASDKTANDFVSRIVALKKLCFKVAGDAESGYTCESVPATDKTANMTLSFSAGGTVKYSGKIGGKSVGGTTTLNVDGGDYFTIGDLAVPLDKTDALYLSLGFDRDERGDPLPELQVFHVTE